MKKLILATMLLALMCACFSTASASWNQANLYRSMVVGYYGTVTQDGNFRAAADEYSDVTGRAGAGDEYLIYGFARNESTGNYWYLVEINGFGYYSWISAGVMDVDMEHAGCLEGEGYCIITVDGGKARANAGTQYEQRAVVTAGNGFQVLESRNAGGKPWYRISVEGISCWISSGICDFYAYN